MIGSGIAGLVAALAASTRARVTVVTKGALDDGCSRWAQGGIAAAVASDDAPDLHYADTPEYATGQHIAWIFLAYGLVIGVVGGGLGLLP